MVLSFILKRISVMIDALNKIVGKVIVPKYPWIKDFYWTYHHLGGSMYYSLELIADKDFYQKHIDSSLIQPELWDEVKTLFRMVGPDENVFFDEVTINPEDYTINW